MPTQYNGIASNTGFASSTAILSSTNATPIVLAFATGHGRTTGDTCAVAGHTVNTRADGIWTVTVIDSTHLSLNGSVGNGVGGATGSLYPRAFNATYPQPSDGDTFAAAAFNPAYGALGDRSAFELTRTGRYSLADLVTVNNNASGSWAITGTVTANAWSIFLDPTATFDINWTVPFTLPGDILEIDFTGTASCVATGTQSLALGYSFVVPGSAGSFTKIPGSAQLIESNAVTFQPFHVKGYIGVTGAGVSQTLIWPIYESTQTTGATMYGDFTIVIKVWRPTGLGQ